MPPPRVSVIIPTYNGTSWLEETIASVTSQSFRDFEIIVVDDGSQEPIQLPLFSEPRLRIIRQENAGTSAARNLALSMAKGEFIAFLDHDDKWQPRKLEKQVNLLNRHTDIGFAFCDYESFGSGDLRPNGFARGVLFEIPCNELEPGVFVLSTPDIFDKLLDDLFVQIPSTWMIRLNLLRKIGGFDPLLRRGGEDLHLALRLADSNCRFAYHTDAMVMRREFSGSLSARSNWQEEMLLVLNLLWENKTISMSAKDQVFSKRKELAKNLARLNIDSGLYKEAQKKLKIALEGSSPFEKTTLINLFYLLKAWLKEEYSGRNEANL